MNTERLPFSAADVALIKSRLGELERDERVLLTWCLALGCRPSEVFSVDHERTVDGHRAVWLNSRVCAASRRLLPLSSALIELHPDPIDGPVITADQRRVTRRVNAWLRKIGLDPAKSLYSARYRANDQLRRHATEDGVARACLGIHNDDDFRSHGARYPMPVLAQAMERIGF